MLPPGSRICGHKVSHGMCQILRSGLKGFRLFTLAVDRGYLQAADL
jgi:hypothetical protein